MNMADQILEGKEVHFKSSSRAYLQSDMTDRILQKKLITCTTPIKSTCSSSSSCEEYVEEMMTWIGGSGHSEPDISWPLQRAFMM
jgi:hypothetical protein